MDSFQVKFINPSQIFHLFSSIQSLNVFEGGTDALSALQCAFRLVEDETTWWVGAELWLDSAKGREPTRPLAGSSDKLIASINSATSARGMVLIFRSRDSGRSRKSPFIMAVLLETS